MYSFYDLMQMGGMPQMKNGGDPDGEMAIGQIMAMHQKLSALQKFIQPDSDLEPWVASKLTLADDYLNSVADYMQYNPEESGEMQSDNESQEGLPMEQMRSGGYTVTRSNDRKGKTHKVTGPDGTVKYFGDSKLGQHPKDPERKAAFYARHKKNLDRNPYFRAFARATWKEGGETDLPKYQIDGWVQDAANGKFFCKAFGRPDMGGGSGGYYTTAKEAKPVSNFDYISNLDNDLWFGKDELKQVRKTRPKDVDDKVWNALNSDARWVTNDFTNKSRWDADKINPATGRLDDKYLADEWRPKLNISNRYRHYNNIFKDKTGPVTAQDLYNYYSAQPGGWEAYKTLVNNDYMPQKKDGGNFSGIAYYNHGGFIPMYNVGGMPCYECGGMYQDGGWHSEWEQDPMAQTQAVDTSSAPLWHAEWEQDPYADYYGQSDYSGSATPVAAQPAAQKASINYQGVSIVDLLGSVGKASDYNSRKQLAAELGIDNYYGSAQQNLEMIKRITKDPSVLNDYKTASAYKPKAKTASRSKSGSGSKVSSNQPAYNFSDGNWLRNGYNPLSFNPLMAGQMPLTTTPTAKTDSKNIAAAKMVNAANAQDAEEAMTFAKYKAQDPYFFAEESDPGWVKAVDYPFTMLRDLGARTVYDRDPMAVAELLAMGLGTRMLRGRTRIEPYYGGQRSLPAPNIPTRSLPAPRIPSVPRGPVPGPPSGGYISPKNVTGSPRGFEIPGSGLRSPGYPMFKKGGPVVGDVMDVSPEQLEILRAQGYDFEII